MSLPIRVRLSLSYFLSFALASLLLGTATWDIARHNLLFELDHEMDEHIDDVRDLMAADRAMGNEVEARAAIMAEFALKDEGKWLQIEDSHGHWIYRSPHMMRAPHNIPLAASLPVKGSFLDFAMRNEPVRSLRRAFTLDGHVWVVESGESLEKTNEVLACFRDDLMLIAPIVLLIAGVAGHMLSQRALDPVAAIAREAQHIHEGNLQTRLPRLETHDELAHLSVTLNVMLERIESGVRSVRDFTAHASHELRTPVALIRSEADLALRFERSPAQYRDALSVIGTEALQMSTLLDSLLFLARVDARTEEERLEAVDALQVCTEAAARWQPVFCSTRTQFLAELPSDPVMVFADRLYLPRLLNIILENAARYTAPGGSVRLSLTSDGREADFAVSDTGIGISAQDQSHIFDRFYRAASVRADRIPGSGLGLSLAAWIATRHRAKINVESAVGVGSRFSWTLPFELSTADGFTTRAQESSAEQECRASLV